MAADNATRFCTECGMRMKEGERFCTNCGHDSLEDHVDSAEPGDHGEAGTLAEERGETSQADAIELPEEGAGSGTPTEGETKPRWTRRKKVILAVCVFAGALACFLGGYAVVKNHEARVEAAQKAAYQTAHEEKAVAISITAPNYSEGSTRIPLHVTGTDLDGKKVDKVAYVSGGKDTLKLRQGTYQIQPVASPILADGTVYQVPKDGVEVTVGGGASSWKDSSEKSAEAVSPFSPGDGGSSVDSAEGDHSGDGASGVKVSGSIEFSVPDAYSVTDQMIDEARKAASSDPQDDGKAEKLAQTATKKRDDAVVEKKAADEKAAQERAAEQRKAYFEQYADIINSQKNELSEMYGGNPGPRYLVWALYDIDGDGSPELLTRCVNDDMAGDDCLSCVSGISQGKARELVGFHCEMRDWYFLSSDGVLRESGSGGAYTGFDDYFHVTSGGVEKFASASWDRTNPDDLGDTSVTYLYSNSDEGVSNREVDSDFVQQLEDKHPTKSYDDFDWEENPLG